jgi:resolvase-like protein/recombinase
VDAFEEVETGKVNSRPALAQALAACNAAFLLSVVEGSGQGDVVFCDLPQVPPGPSGKFVIAIMAAVAELEAGLISERTKAALAQAKARGVTLGNPRLQPGAREQAIQAAAAKWRQAIEHAAGVLPYIQAARKAGCSTLAQLAAALNARGVRTARGGPWHAATVWRVLDRDAGAGATQ